MLDFIYYPVSFILWFWHQAFGFVLGETQAVSWALAIIFLTFTIRAILFKPFVSQVRSMRKMQDFAPEIKKIQKRYGNDKQRQAQEMQKLQREHGVNPLGGCLPIFLQIPVFIGLNHTLRMFARSEERGEGNYFFSADGVQQYIQADIFGSNLGEAIYNTEVAGGGDIANAGFHAAAVPVAVPMMILAAILTHFTARHSVQRQNPAAATQQTAIMNKMTQYVFPVGLLVFGALLPLGLLLYFLANNGWTLMQQRLVYTWIDREEEKKKAEAAEKRSDLGPKPGQKPTKSKDASTPSGKKGGEDSSGESSGEQHDGGTAEASGHQNAGQSGGGKQGTAKQGGRQGQQNQGSQRAKQQGKQAGPGGQSAKQRSQAGKQGSRQSQQGQQSQGGQGGKRQGKQAGSSAGKQGGGSTRSNGGPSKSGTAKSSGAAKGSGAAKSGDPSGNGKTQANERTQRKKNSSQGSAGGSKQGDAASGNKGTTGTGTDKQGSKKNSTRKRR